MAVFIQTFRSENREILFLFLMCQMKQSCLPCSRGIPHGDTCIHVVEVGITEESQKGHDPKTAWQNVDGLFTAQQLEGF